MLLVSESELRPHGELSALDARGFTARILVAQAMAERTPVGLQIAAPAIFKSYEDFFSKNTRKQI